MLITNDETRNLPYWLCNKKIAWKKQSCFESSRTISIVVLKWAQNQFLWLRRDLLTCEYASTSLLWRRFGAPVHAAIPKNNSTSGAISQQANSNRELGHLQRNPDFHNRVKVCPTIAEIVARTKGLLFAIFSRNHSLGEEQIPHQNNNWIIKAWWKGWTSAYLTSSFRSLSFFSLEFPTSSPISWTIQSWNTYLTLPDYEQSFLCLTLFTNVYAFSYIHSMAKFIFSRHSSQRQPKSTWLLLRLTFLPHDSINPIIPVEEEWEVKHKKKITEVPGLAYTS